MPNGDEHSHIGDNRGGKKLNVVESICSLLGIPVWSAPLGCAGGLLFICLSGEYIRRRVLYHRSLQFSSSFEFPLQPYLKAIRVRRWKCKSFWRVLRNWMDSNLPPVYAVVDSMCPDDAQPVVDRGGYVLVAKSGERFNCYKGWSSSHDALELLVAQEA